MESTKLQLKRHRRTRSLSGHHQVRIARVVAGGSLSRNASRRSQAKVASSIGTDVHRKEHVDTLLLHIAESIDKIRDGEIIDNRAMRSDGAVHHRDSGPQRRINLPQRGEPERHTTRGSPWFDRFAALIPGRKFPFPKSSIRRRRHASVLRAHTSRMPLIVDFFGGSGTTTHAVARLNKQDGGQPTLHLDHEQRSVRRRSRAPADQEGLSPWRSRMGGTRDFRTGHQAARCRSAFTGT